MIPSNGTPVEFINKEVVFIRNGDELRAGWLKTGAVIIAKRLFFPSIMENYFNIEVRVPRVYVGRTQGLLGVLGNDGDGSNDLFTRNGDVPLTGTDDKDLLGPLLSCKLMICMILIVYAVHKTMILCIFM